jgi:hypothetical protein
MVWARRQPGGPHQCHWSDSDSDLDLESEASESAVTVSSESESESSLAVLTSTTQPEWYSQLRHCHWHRHGDWQYPLESYFPTPLPKPLALLTAHTP